MMIEQSIEKQQQHTASFSSKLENLYTNLNEKFESLSTRMKQLDTQMDQVSSSTSRKDSQEAHASNIPIQDDIQMDHG